jgi:hypothetical protein
MTYNPQIDSGFCKTKSWVQVPSAVFTAIEQSTEYDNSSHPDRSRRNYAQMVYNVGDSDPSTGAGSVTVSELYSRIVEVIGTDTYIAHAPVGSLSTDAVWRVQKIDTNGSRMWADGNINFDNVASSPLSALTFSY